MAIIKISDLAKNMSLPTDDEIFQLFQKALPFLDYFTEKLN
jgi:hypothetical protein